MREIKFRAWDKESKRIFNIARFDFADHTVYSHLFACDGYLAENLKIMQYTGLTDKNGTEIYEGDIITYESVYGGIKTDYVEFNAGSFNPSQVVGWGVHRSVEVIGNKYEHPHLI